MACVEVIQRAGVPILPSFEPLPGLGVRFHSITGLDAISSSRVRMESSALLALVPARMPLPRWLLRAIASPSERQLDAGVLNYARSCGLYGYAPDGRRRVRLFFFTVGSPVVMGAVSWLCGLARR